VTVLSPLGDNAYPNVLGYSAGYDRRLDPCHPVQLRRVTCSDCLSGFSLALAGVLLSLGALSRPPVYKAFFAAVVVNFLAILSPQNEPSYDLARFLNNELAVVAGRIVGCLWWRCCLRYRQIGGPRASSCG
jgi:hypothetical protein